MAHSVTFNVPERPVGSAGIVFKVKKDDGRFGWLKVSKGSVVWWPRSKSKGYRLSWDQIDTLARDEGRRGDYTL